MRASQSHPSGNYQYQQQRCVLHPQDKGGGVAGALLLAETVNSEKSIIEATDNVLASIRIMRRKSVKDQVREEFKYQLLLLMMKVVVVVLNCIF